MKNVLILYGGKSDEKEISKDSAVAIHNCIDKTKFKADIIDYEDLRLNSIDKDTIIFIAIHGKGGEDGEIQKILSTRNIKFTGSDESSAKKCWDKISSKNLMIKNHIPTPNFLALNENEKVNLNDSFFKNKDSFFVKPNRNGSSFGVTKVESEKDIESAAEEARKFSKEVIIEEAYNNAEYTVGILKGEALEPLEIIADPKSGFYNYNAKYLSKETKKVEVLNKDLKNELKKIALKAFYHHGCQTWGRVDFVFDGDRLGVLEINTVPGFTEKSLFPLAAKLAGINYEELITEIIEDSY